MRSRCDCRAASLPRFDSHNEYRKEKDDVSILNLQVQELTASALYGEINRGMRALKSADIHEGTANVQVVKAWRCARPLITLLCIIPFMSEGWRSGLAVLVQKLDAFSAAVNADAATRPANV
jgi:hypothetical protein